jgi:hypothetical protein
MTPSIPVVNESRVFQSLSHARLRVQRAPGFPCALFTLGCVIREELGRYLRRGIADSCLLFDI